LLTRAKLTDILSTMTFEEIKKLTLEDFIHKNDEVWSAIHDLTIEQIRELRGSFNQTDVNEDDEIQQSLHEILQEKISSHLKLTVIDKLTEEQKDMFAFLFFEKDGTWDTLRIWDMVEGNL